MQTAQTDVYSDAVCSAVWGAIFDAAAQLCAGSLPPYTPSDPSGCWGDSGGPLAWTIPSNTAFSLLTGATSYGPSGGCTTAPLAYTRVAYYSSWIMASTGLQPPANLTVTTVSSSETTAHVRATVDTGGASTLVTLDYSDGGTTGTDDFGWYSSSGQSTADLTTLKLWPGSSYTGLYSVTAASWYGQTTIRDFTIETDDWHPPSIQVQSSKGRRGRVVRFHITARDNSPWIGWDVQITRGHHVLRRFHHNIGRPSFTITQLLSWRIPRSATAPLRACGTAFDGTGNRSETACAAIRIKN
jgi:hypothetical protein